jgi:hypothetical protein
MATEHVISGPWTPFINQGVGDSALPQNNRSGKGYARYTPNAAIQLTATPDAGVVLPAEANSMVLSVKDNPIRYRTDGTDPTASEGLYLPVGVWFFEDQRAWMEQFRFIDTAAGASEVTVAYGIVQGG